MAWYRGPLFAHGLQKPYKKSPDFVTSFEHEYNW
jgi:hypothetical protein